MTAKKNPSLMDRAKQIGDDARQTGRDVWLAGLGTVAYADEQARSVYHDLIERGASFEKSERNLLGRALEDAASRARTLGNDVETRFQDTVTTMLQRAGVPSREEISTLIDRVEKLTREVEARV